jgi:DNA-binding NtrC family response regulator
MERIYNRAMRKILIIDRQKWIEDLFHEAFQRDGYRGVFAQDAAGGMKYIKTDRFDLVLLSLYLKDGYCVWDVLKKIKISKPNLPVIILAAHDRYLYAPESDLADSCVAMSWSAAEELRIQVNALLDNKFQASPRCRTLGISGQVRPLVNCTS